MPGKISHFKPEGHPQGDPAPVAVHGAAPAASPAAATDASTDAAEELLWTCAAAPGGYGWWYVDLVGQGYALTVILFAGAVFSPWYGLRARRGQRDSGLLHPGVNVSLLRLDGRRARTVAWVNNLYPPAALSRRPGGVGIGASGLSRGGDGAVRLTLDEDTTRFFGRPGPRLRGEVVLLPEGPALAPLRISGEGAAAHYWQPRSLRARAEAVLSLDGQALRLGGLAYHDSNYGAGRLEAAFARWSWAHGVAAEAGEAGAAGVAHGAGEDALVLYQVIDLDGASRGVAVRRRHGQVTVVGPAPLSASEARVRPARGLLLAPLGFGAHGLSCAPVPGPRLLAAPFYARYHAALRSSETGASLGGVGEQLDLVRFRSPVLQFLLRYKTRRIYADGRRRLWDFLRS